MCTIPPAALAAHGLPQEALPGLHVCRDHRTVLAMHSHALEGPARFLAATAAAQVGLHAPASRAVSQGPGHVGNEYWVLLLTREGL